MAKDVVVIRGKDKENEVLHTAFLQAVREVNELRIVTLNPPSLVLTFDFEKQLTDLCHEFIKMAKSNNIQKET